MKTAVIVLVDGVAGGGPIFPVSAAPLAPVVEETERDEEREEDEGDSEDEVTLGAAHLLKPNTEVSLWLSLATELLGLGGVEDVRGVGALTAVMVTVTHHPLSPHPSYPLPLTTRPWQHASKLSH